MEDYKAKEARKINVGLKDVKISGDTVLRKNVVKSFHKTFHRFHGKCFIVQKSSSFLAYFDVP